MRIAQIMLSEGFGGAERSFVDICEKMQELGHDVLAIGSKRSKSLDKLKSAGVISKRVSCLGTWDIFTIKAIKKTLITFKPDVIQCHLARASYLGGTAGVKLKIPVVAKTHNLVNPKYYNNVSSIVVTTEAQKRHLLLHGVELKRLQLIPNFSSTNPKTKTKIKSVTRKPNLYRIKSLGRFVRKKGFDTLIRAIRLVKLRTDWNIILSLGGDGPEDKALRQLVNELDISKLVEFCGWIEDVPGFLFGADLFVLPSRNEPFGIVILEAMAAGVPIVATKTQGPLEILDRDCASFTSMDDPGQMADDIIDMLKSDQRFAKASASLKKFEEVYSSDKVVESYCALFRELLGQ